MVIGQPASASRLGRIIGSGRPGVGPGDTVSSTAEESAAKSGASAGAAGRNDSGTPDVRPDRSITVVRMFPSSSELTVGDGLSITLDLSAGTDVGHVPFHLLYDPAVLHFESGEEGAFLGSDGMPTAFFVGPSRSGDSVVVGLSRLGRVQGVDGGGPLCTLQFTAVGPGHAGLVFARANVRDSSNHNVPSEFEAVDVRVR